MLPTFNHKQVPRRKLCQLRENKLICHCASCTHTQCARSNQGRQVRVEQTTCQVSTRQECASQGNVLQWNTAVWVCRPQKRCSFTLPMIVHGPCLSLLPARRNWR